MLAVGFEPTRKNTEHLAVSLIQLGHASVFLLKMLETKNQTKIK